MQRPSHSTHFPYTTLFRSLAEAEGFRRELANHLQNARLYHGLETEKIFAALVIASLSGQPVQATEVRSEENTSELQSPMYLVWRLLFDRKNTRLNSSHRTI